MASRDRQERIQWWQASGRQVAGHTLGAKPNNNVSLFDFYLIIYLNKLQITFTSLCNRFIWILANKSL